MGRYINRDEVLISMSNSNSNYQNLIFENFRGLDKILKKNYVTVYIVHVGRKKIYQVSLGHL